MGFMGDVLQIRLFALLCFALVILVIRIIQIVFSVAVLWLLGVWGQGAVEIQAKAGKALVTEVSLPMLWKPHWMRGHESKDTSLSGDTLLLLLESSHGFPGDVWK